MIAPTEEEKANAKKKKQEKREKQKVDIHVYERLMRGLKPLASDPTKSNIGIIDEFEVVDYGTDPDRLESCICGKDRLKHLFFIQKKQFYQKRDHFVETYIVGKI